MQRESIDRPGKGVEKEEEMVEDKGRCCGIKKGKEKKKKESGGSQRRRRRRRRVRLRGRRRGREGSSRKESKRGPI